MRIYDVVVEERMPGAIGEFGRRRINGIVSDSDEGAMRQAFQMVRDSGKETRGAWVIISRGPLTPEETDEAAYYARRGSSRMGTHWINPWSDAVPVPIEELVLCVHESYCLTPEEMLSHWDTHGPELDAYILPGPPGGHCIGVRYGNEGSEYISPLENQERTEQLLAKYRP